MKSITKLMVVAMLLAAALVVAPAAAARTITENGSTVYIGEENVNLTAIFDHPAGGGEGVLVYYSSTTGSGDDRSGTIEKTISVANTSDFELTATDFGSLTGQWYAFAEGDKDLTALATADGNILVQKPSVKLNVKLWDKEKGKVSADSVDGKTVTRKSDIAFEIEHNLGGVDPAFQIDIEVTTPSGGKLTTFGEELKGIDLTGQKVPKGPISLEGREAGTYTAVAKWPSSSDFYDKGYDSNTVTFEILTKKLAISSNKDSVVRGNNFVVTITGESKT
ncbi:MAG: DUF3821 domain-containing protein, partial [Candidatus Methanoculleus thermohydrogenotrophicum]